MLRLIFSIVLLILILSFFGISLQSLVHSPITQDNFHFAGQLVAELWHALLANVENVFGVKHA